MIEKFPLDKANDAFSTYPPAAVEFLGVFADDRFQMPCSRDPSDSAQLSLWNSLSPLCCG